VCETGRGNRPRPRPRTDLPRRGVHLVRQAAIRQGCSEVLQGLSLDHSNQGVIDDRGVVASRQGAPLQCHRATRELPAVLLSRIDGDGQRSDGAPAGDSSAWIGSLDGLLRLPPHGGAATGLGEDELRTRQLRAVEDEVDSFAASTADQHGRLVHKATGLVPGRAVVCTEHSRRARPGLPCLERCQCAIRTTTGGG
jgi:hypothetical protein